MRAHFLPITFLVFAALIVVAQEKSANNPQAEVDAGLGTCSAEFQVTDAGLKPLFNAKVRTQIKYGFAGVRKIDLEVATNVDGKARIKGLPEKAKNPIPFIADLDGRRSMVLVDPGKQCQGSYNIVLPDRAAIPTEKKR